MESLSRAVSLFMAMMLMASLLFPLLSHAQVIGPDESGPTITDTTVATPVTGQEFTVTADVTDPSGVVLVRLYLYFKISTGISPSQVTFMQKIGQEYRHTFQVPNDASVLHYTISANDTLNNWSISDVISRNVRDDQPPTAICQASIAIDAGGTVTFNGTASTDNVGIDNYTWSFSYGGSTVLLYGPAPEFKFVIPGQYTGTLLVKDPWGNTDTAGFIVTIRDTEPPVADAGIQIYMVAGNRALFDGTGSTDNAGIENYTWSFTHNRTAVLLYGPSPTFRFWIDGTYEVTLTVRDTAGNTDTDTVEVHVLRQPRESSGVSWWVYALIIMVFLMVVAAIIIIRI